MAHTSKACHLEGQSNYQTHWQVYFVLERHAFYVHAYNII